MMAVIIAVFFLLLLHSFCRFRLYGITLNDCVSDKSGIDLKADHRCEIQCEKKICSYESVAKEKNNSLLCVLIDDMKWKSKPSAIRILVSSFLPEKCAASLLALRLVWMFSFFCCCRFSSAQFEILYRAANKKPDKFSEAVTTNSHTFNDKHVITVGEIKRKSCVKIQ